MRSKLRAFLVALFAIIVSSGSVSAFEWTGETLADGNFYLYNRAKGRYLKAGSTSTTNPQEATLFKLTGGKKWTQDIYYSISYVENGSTIYASQNRGKQTWSTTVFDEWKIEAENGGYYINDWASNEYAWRYRYLSVETNGTVSYPYENFVNDERTWILISEAQFNAVYPQKMLRASTALNNTGVVVSDWTTREGTTFNRTVLSNGSWCVESYTDDHLAGNYLMLTVSNLAPGYYNLSMNAFAAGVDREVSGNGAQLKVNTRMVQNIPCQTVSSGSNGNASVYTFQNILVSTDGKLTIAVVVTNTNVNWVLASIRSLSRSDYSVVEKTGGVIFAAGQVQYSDITALLTSEVYAVDMEYATLQGTTLPVNVSNGNPNLLVYASAGQVSNTKNVVTNGLCANYELVDANYPVGVPTSFTATTATYTMNAIAGEVMGTLILPFAAPFPADGKGYALTEDISNAGNVLYGMKMDRVESNTPMLVTKKGTYTNTNVVVNVVTHDDTYEAGNLIGVYAPDAAPVGSYVLQNHTDDGSNTGVTGVAFYEVVASSGTNLRPFRAYIRPQSDTNVKAIKIVLDDEETSIDELSLASEPRGAYDLSGRRVENPTRGLYIINGKKVLLK